MPDAESDNTSETRQERRERKLQEKEGTDCPVRQRSGENLP